MSFKVQEIVNSNTIKVTPRWQWKEMTGVLVKIAGYEPSSEAADFTKHKLETLLNNTEIELKNPQEISHLILHCEVYLNGVNISQYFQEFA